MSLMIRPSGSLLRGTLWVMVLVAATVVPVGAAAASGDDRAPSPARSRPVVGHTLADWVWQEVALEGPRRLGPGARHRLGQDLGRQVMERLAGHGLLLRPWALEDLTLEIGRRAAQHLLDGMDHDDGYDRLVPLSKEFAAHVAAWVRGIAPTVGPVAADPAPTPTPSPSAPEAVSPSPSSGSARPAEAPPATDSGAAASPPDDPQPPATDDPAAGVSHAEPGPGDGRAEPAEGVTAAPPPAPIAGRSATDVAATARPGVVNAAVRIGAQPLSLPVAAIGIFGLGLVATSRVGRSPDGGPGVGVRRGRGRPFR